MLELKAQFSFTFKEIDGVIVFAVRRWSTLMATMVPVRILRAIDTTERPSAIL